MGKPQSRKKNWAKDKRIYKRHRTRQYGRDNDQIFEDLQQPEKYKDRKEDEDLPGLGQFYCVSCALDFVDQLSLNEHQKTKRHKRRVKELKEEPFNIKQARILNK